MASATQSADGHAPERRVFLRGLHGRPAPVRADDVLFRPSSVSVAEGNSGPRPDPFTFTLSASPPRVIFARYASAPAPPFRRFGGTRPIDLPARSIIKSGRDLLTITITISRDTSGADESSISL